MTLYLRYVHTGSDSGFGCPGNPLIYLLISQRNPSLPLVTQLIDLQRMLSPSPPSPSPSPSFPSPPYPSLSPLSPPPPSHAPPSTSPPSPPSTVSLSNISLSTISLSTALPHLKQHKVSERSSSTTVKLDILYSRYRRLKI